MLSSLVLIYGFTTKTSIRDKASADEHYRFYIYCKINPQLLPSPFLNCATSFDSITRFRLGSHKLPIETGRWSRTPRENRLCPICHVLGDEYYFVFRCSETIRTQNFTEDLGDIWKNESIFELFKELSVTISVTVSVTIYEIISL